MWTLIHNGTEKSFADWGIENVVRKLLSQAPDELTFDVPSAFDGAGLFAYGDTVTIYRDRNKTSGSFNGGTIWFFGRRISDPRRASATGETIHYLFAGPWWYLENIVYQQKWNVYTDPANPANSLVGGFRSHLILNQGDNGAALTTAQQITDAVNYAAVEALAPIAVDATLPAINIPFDERRDITCAEVIRKQLRWIPDAVTWFDYSVSPPKLYVRRRNDLAAASLAVDGTGKVESVDVTSREDLQRSAVVLKFEQTNEINGAPWHTVTEQKAPANATGKEIGALLLTIQLQGFSLQVVSAEITAATIDAAAANDATRLAWWQKRLPSPLASGQVANLQIGSVVRETAHPRELTAGQVPPWSAYTAVEETIKAKATYTVLEAAGGNPSREVVGEDISVRVIATDAVTGVIRNVQSYESGESVPSGLADAIYTAVNALQYSGQVILAEDEVSGAVGMGKVLNITGGRAAWSTMRALVQQVNEDVDNGRTTIIFGPAGHLGADDLIELLRVNRTRWNYTNPSSRTSGQGNSGQLALGKQTPKENSGAGAGNHKRIVVFDGDVRIDIDAATKRIFITGAAGEGSVEIQLTASGSSLGTGGHEIKLRELDVCENGVAKKVRVLSSTPYSP